MACVIPLNLALAHLLYGVHRLNASVFSLVLLILLLCGFAATFVRASRAASVDAMRVLRQE